ncbi:MAG: hypothetical protein KF775_09035 [Cyclobacteriaceae bacterium]|nr:hypothetical protein [Cyclobacteriaceae bacterium]
MSVSKVILIVVLCGLGMFILLLYVALSPTIRTVSKNVAFSSILNKPVTSTTKLYLQQYPTGSYRFISNVLSRDSISVGTTVLDIPSGSSFTIKAFKKYTNNAGSGSTSIYVLGEYAPGKDAAIAFEYYWGSVDNTKGASSKLPVAFWQTEADQQIIFINR